MSAISNSVINTAPRTSGSSQNSALAGNSVNNGLLTRGNVPGGNQPRGSNVGFGSVPNNQLVSLSELSKFAESRNVSTGFVGLGSLGSPTLIQTIGTDGSFSSLLGNKFGLAASKLINLPAVTGLINGGNLISSSMGKLGSLMGESKLFKMVQPFTQDLMLQELGSRQLVSLANLGSMDFAVEIADKSSSLRQQGTSAFQLPDIGGLKALSGEKKAQKQQKNYQTRQTPTYSLKEDEKGQGKTRKSFFGGFYQSY